MSQTYTVKQVAEILGYSTNSIYTFLKEKRIKGVRIGKGRFRVPQSELNRLLSDNGKSKSLAVTTPENSLKATAIDVERIVETAPVSFEVIGFWGKLHLNIPNVFDWFIGAVALFTGMTLFLFNSSFDSSSIAYFVPYIQALGAVLMVVGGGLLVASILGNEFWKKIFHLILIIMAGVMSVIFWINLDYDGVFIYASISLILVIADTVRLSGSAKYILYTLFLALGTPILFWFGQKDPHVDYIRQLSGLPVSIGTAIFAFAAVALIFSVVWAYFRDKQLLWFISLSMVVVQGTVGFFYVGQGIWSRAYIFVIMAVTSLLLPLWGRAQLFKARRIKFLSLLILGSILTFVFFSILGIWLMQVTLADEAKQDFANKIVYGKELLEEILGTAQSNIETAAKNPELITAVTEKNPDAQRLDDLAKFIFNNNHNFRRVFILDKNGESLAHYPNEVVTATNFASRDYFQAVKKTNGLYMTDLFAAATTDQRKAIVIAAPILNNKQEFVGLITGSLNLDKINNDFQKLTSPKKDEFYVVMDQNARWIFHPDANLLYTEADPKDLVRRGLSGESGVGQTYTSFSAGQSALAAYSKIDTRLTGERPWAIGIKAPISKIYKLNQNVNFSIFTVILVLILVVTLLLLFLLWRSVSFEAKADSP